MSSTPRWFRPVAIVALIWNLIGCAAFVADLRLTHEDIARLSAAQQAMYAARPAWSVAATGIAVVAGALGCIGLLIRKRWAYGAFLLSLLGVIAQDVSLFATTGAASLAGSTALILQGLVLLIAIGLAALGSTSIKRGWIA